MLLILIMVSYYACHYEQGFMQVGN